MAFTFRLQDDNFQHGLSNTTQHWDDSVMFNGLQIAAIKSSNINSENQPTSIPSPFARIALVKTAFAEVAEHGTNALKAYQKIVSDSLDVAEIFFTFDKWKQKVEIIPWKYGRKADSPDLEDDSDLKKLHNGHRQLYKTLKTFLESDAVEYNFDRMKCIYILKYKNTGDMIGATSPCTLFFSTANDCNNIDIQLNSQHKAFEGIVPLSQRNWDFQKYLYSWIAENNENRISVSPAVSIFKEFVNYLDAQKTLINRTEEIDALNTVDTNVLRELRSPDVDVLGKPLYQSKATPPERWAADDILEDSIIKLPYEINKDSFFDGNLPNKSKQTYLLPIKEKFFQHYSIADLRKFLKINHSGDVVDIELNIKTRNYKKRYSKVNGNLIELTFDCAIFPNIKFENDILAHYRFGLVCDFKEKDKFKAKFVNINSPIDPNKTRFSVRNETKEKNYQLKNYSLEGASFDYLEIYYNGVKGILVPQLALMSGNEEFTFAVDFGTTNTHIEYKLNNEREIKTFEILKEQIDEKQVHWLHGKEDYLKEVFDEEYIPAYTDDEFKLPMRTALSYGENTFWNDVYPFEKASLNELYEKRLDYPYNETETNLKWSDDANYKKQVEVYIKSLMYLLRNKVVIGNGRLEKTKIRWFYPVSMERQRFNNLANAWNDAYKKYFGGIESNIISITESVAPFEFYVKDRDANNLVTIDIGGGTTDIVISASGKVDYITSFRFAANSIFGDGYAENNRVKNGIIRQFFNEIKTELLQSKINKDNELFQIFDIMFKEKSSADIASFLFSLRHNKKVRAEGTNLSENVNLSKKLIDDTTQKITFIFFYSAIIYHLAKLMKAKDLPLPDKIVFSGNGSRVIQFFTDDDDLLKGFAKLIFEKVHDKKYSSIDLAIIRNKENPKEATCKGGFFVDEPATFSDVLKKKVVLHSNGSDEVIHRVGDINEEVSSSTRYNFIDDYYLKHTEEEAKKFIQFVFDLLPFFNNEGYQLNNTSIELAKEVCFKKLDIHTKNGWQQKEKEISKEEIIDETLFFYPLVGMFKELTDAICDKNLKTKN